MTDVKTGRASLISFLVILSIVSILSLIMIRPYLIAVMMGGILAVLCAPLYHRFCGGEKRSKRASVLVTSLMLLLVLTPLVLFSILGLREGISIMGLLRLGDPAAAQQWIDRIGQWSLVKLLVDDLVLVEQEIKRIIQLLGHEATGALFSIISRMPEVLLQAILAVLTSFFLLIDGPRFFRWARERIPLNPTIRTHLVDAFKETSVPVIWATFAASSAQAIIILTGFLVLRVPGGVLAAGAAFFCAWIPMIGTSPVWISGAIYLLFQQNTLGVILMVFIGLGAGVTDNVIRATVLKGRARMHPLVSLISIFGGIHLFGIVGVFFGPIIAAILILLLDAWSQVCARNALIDHHSGSTKK